MCESPCQRGDGMNGWIKVSRSLSEHWLWHDEPFSRGQAWIDLLMLADYKDNKVAYKGEIIDSKRGDVNRSITYLADRWQWSRDKVRRFLKTLEADGMIRVSATKHRTTISIENYTFYQVECATDKATNRQQAAINKNRKNNIIINNNIYSDVPAELLPAFMEFSEMRKKIKKPITSKQTVTRQLNTLYKLSAKREEQIAILNQSTDNCWQGLFPLKAEIVPLPDDRPPVRY